MSKRRKPLDFWLNKPREILGPHIVDVPYGQPMRFLRIDVRKLGFRDVLEMRADPDCARYIDAEIAKAERGGR